MTFTLPSPVRRSLLAEATDLYAKSLSSVLPYLESRGITEDIAREWQLGYVQEPVDESHERMTGRIAIPYITDSGPMGMKFRCIENHDCKKYGHGKYDKIKGEPTYLFGAWTLTEADTNICLAVEGELDTVVGWSVVGYPSAGVPGANNWQDHWVYVFEGFDEVVVIRDGDVERRGKDGQVIPPAADAFVNTLTDNLPNARVVHLPDGHDTNSFVLDFGPDKFKEVAKLP